MIRVMSVNLFMVTGELPVAGEKFQAYQPQTIKQIGQIRIPLMSKQSILVDNEFSSRQE